MPEPLRKLDPEIPEDLEQLMIRALEKDPEKRLERADEFAAGLYLISQKLRGPGAAPPVQVAPPEPAVDLAPPAFAPTFASAPPPPVAPIPVVLPAQAVAVSAQPAAASLPGAPPPTIAAPPPVQQAPIGIKMRWIPYAIAAVLTFCISLSFFSRQSIHASQVKPATAIVRTPQRSSSNPAGCFVCRAKRQP